MSENQALAAKIKSKIAVDAMISATDIAVSVDDGEVTLTGEVDNYAQLDRAVTLVGSTAGVSQIKNELKVGGPKRSVFHHSLALFGLVTDAECKEIEEKMRIALTENSVISPEKVKTHVYASGTVELSGVVPDQKVKRFLENYAWQLPKVNHVSNRLQTLKEQEEQPSEDESQSAPIGSLVAAAKLKAALVVDDTVKRPLSVSVDVRDNRIVLGGDVDNYAAKDSVVHHAKEIFSDMEIEDEISVAEQKDVKKLVSNLKADVDPMFERDHVAPYPMVVPGIPPITTSNVAPVGYYPAVVHRGPLNDQARIDAEQALEQSISGQPEYDPDAVRCHVNNHGTAILEGKVSSIKDARNLEDTAWETRGVDHVVNGLKVA